MSFDNIKVISRCIMIGSKYRPFQEQTKDVVVDLNEKIEEIDRVGCDGKSIVIQSKGWLTVVSTEGKQMVKIKIEKQISNIVMMPSFLAAFYQVDTNTFTVIRDDFVVQYIQREQQSNWENSSYQLEYFKNNGIIVLIQKNVEENIAKLCFYQYQSEEETLKFTQDYVASSQQWNSSQQIFKVNQDGMLGWCWTGKQGINISLYSCKYGFKNFENIQNSWSQEAQILAMACSQSNLLHLAVKEASSYEQTKLPIIIIEMKDNFNKIEKVRSARVFQMEIIQSGEIAEAMALGKYIIFKLVEAETSKTLVYSLEVESFVHQYMSNDSSHSKMSNLSLATDQFIEGYYDNPSQIRLLIHKICRVNSLSALKLFQVLGKIDEISARKEKKKVILICGAHKSGKSTLRHFICGEEMQHVFLDDVGYYELRAKSQSELRYKLQIENDCLVGIGETEEAIVVEMFDWSQLSYFRTQTLILIEAIFKKFKFVHFVVTIPYEQVQDSIRNEQVLKQLIEIINFNSSDNISTFISIVLTKIEDESALQEFGQRIEEIGQLNEEIGEIIKKIKQQQRIYLFENKEYNQQQSEIMKTKILQSSMMQVQEGVYLKLQGQLTKDEDSQQGVACLQRESQFYLYLMNNILQYLSSWIVKVPSYFPAERFKREVFHIQEKMEKQENGAYLGKLYKEVEANCLEYQFFLVIANLKLFVQKKELQVKEGIQNIRQTFLKLIEQYNKIVNKEDGVLLNSSVAYFITAMTLQSEYIFQNSHSGPYKQVVDILRNSSNSVLGHCFKNIYQKLIQNERIKAQKQLISKLNAYVISEVSKVQFKTKIVPMSYEQQRSFYLKQRDKLLQIICSLPANVMRLDLMMIELGRLCQTVSLASSDFRLAKFYLRQCSRICHFHQLHMQAIIFLMVIPDFIGIEVLVEEMIQLCKGKEYDQKRMMDTQQQNLINQLILITRDCLRDNLTEKLIHLKSLNSESFVKKHGIIQAQEREGKNKELSSQDKYEKYLEKLKDRSSELKLCNFKNELFKKLIQGKNQIVNRCRDFQRGKQTRGIFADRQALNWVLQTVPLPI